ncbi:MAG: hypothetical protein LBJ57_00630, partial [Prevotellaceae bacterium]|nr:hypothetical protein [Prevotellaceae bacterium]
GKEAVFAIYQQDFSAQIALPSGGLKKVMIELQKVKADSDITRLRPYLGMSCQTYCIFILDHDVHFPESSVIHTSSSVRDGSTGENLSATHEFFKSMYHHSWIIQIACLKQRRRNDLETLLSVFDQENLTKSHHTLNVSEDDFPAAYRHIIHRLHMASESSDIQMKMKMEDEYMKQPQNQPKA